MQCSTSPGEFGATWLTIGLLISYEGGARGLELLWIDGIGRCSVLLEVRGD